MGVIDAREAFFQRRRQLICRLAQDPSLSTKRNQGRDKKGKIEDGILVEDHADGETKTLEKAAISLLKDLNARMKPDKKN